jgi:hypothetical protein
MVCKTKKLQQCRALLGFNGEVSSSRKAGIVVCGDYDVIGVAITAGPPNDVPGGVAQWNIPMRG